MTEIVVKTERTVRFDGKHCGAPNGRDCDYEFWNPQEPFCSAFLVEDPDGESVVGDTPLEPDPDDEDGALLRCERCVERFKEGG